MTAPRDLDRLIRTYLVEDQATGQPEVPEHVYAAIRDGIEQTPQRAVIGSWRYALMNNNIVRVGLAAAAVVVIAIIAINLLPGSPAPGAQPSPSASSSEAAPSIAPSTAAGLPVGSSFALSDGQGDQGFNNVRMTVTIPAPGWTGEPGGGILLKDDSADPPDGAGMIVWAGVDQLYVYGDPCHWSTTKPETPSTTVDELVTALAAQASRDASAAVDITLDGYTGKSVTLHVPDDANFGSCDQGYFGSWGDDVEPTPTRYHQGPGEIDEVWVLDVDGLMVVIDWAHYAGTPPADVDELRAIVESTTFEP